MIREGSEVLIRVHDVWIPGSVERLNADRTRAEVKLWANRQVQHLKSEFTVPVSSLVEFDAPTQEWYREYYTPTIQEYLRDVTRREA